MGERPTPFRLKREADRIHDFELALKIEELARHGRVCRLLPDTALQIARALKFQAAYNEGKLGAYTVESWFPRDQGGGIKRTFGRLDQHDAAIGAFEGVKANFPNEILTVRERCRPLRRHNDPEENG